MTTIISFGDIVEENGKTIRENRGAVKHNIPLGTKVSVHVRVHYMDDTYLEGTIHAYVIAHNRDCDGTPLYSVGCMTLDEFSQISGDDNFVVYNHRNLGHRSIMHPHTGYPEESLTVL